MAEKKEKTEAVKEEEVKETPKKKSTTKKTTSKSATTEKKTTAKKETSKKETTKKETSKKETSKKETAKKEPPKKKTTSKKVSENASELEELVKELPGEEIPLNVNPEDDEKIPLDPSTGLDPEKLETELNDLKDLVQEEIDKMMEENPDAEWKDVVKEAKENKGKVKKANVKYCECCGDVEVEEDQDYCSSCLETMKHYPFEWWKFLIPILTVVLVVLSFSYFAISYTIFADTVSANKLIREGKLESALTSFDSTNALIKVSDENFGIRYLNYQVKLYDMLGIDYYEDFNDFVDKYYAGTKIDKWYAKNAVKASEKIDSYQDLYDYFEEAYSESEDYATFVEHFDSAIKNKGLNEAQAYYYKYYAASIYGEDTSVLLENVEKIREIDPDYKSLYLPLLAEISLNDKNYDDVLTYANQLAEFNSESIYSYLYRSIAYRLQGNLTKAVAACNSGLEVDSTDSFINYQMAICCLLQGQTETAYQYASTAYQYAETANSFVSAGSIYSLCAQLNEDTEVNDAIIEEVEYYGYSISPDVAKIVSGELTLEKVFTEGTGDFSWES